MSDEHYRKLEQMYLAAPTNEYYRPAIRITDRAAEIRIQVRRDFFHAANAVHGSVYFKALDDATFFAANSVVEDVFVLTASFNLYLLRPVSEGEIVARGTLVSRTKRLLVAEGVLTDDRGREIARGSGTFVPSGIALAPDIGFR
ncbi:MAG TPA: PaaI family thioesterase [Gemmatimonadaceae bacterium]